MGMDLAQFHEAFFEESFEAIESMEAALLKLDVGAPDPESSAGRSLDLALTTACAPGARVSRPR